MNPKKSNRVKLFLLVLLLLLIFADQISKIMIEKHLVYEGAKIHVIGNFFNIVYVKNNYGAMGLRFGPSWLHLVLSIVATILVSSYLFGNWIKKIKKKFIEELSMILILSGAIGNLIDKIFRHGGVVDFIDLGIGNIRFWSFNVADASISIGAILWILSSFFQHKNINNTEINETLE